MMIPDEIQREIVGGFEALRAKINETSSAKDLAAEIGQYEDRVIDLIPKFFSNDYAGVSIKKIFGTNQDRTITALDFDYALNQFHSFYNGMLKYIDEIKTKDLDSDDVKGNVDQVIENIDGFLRSIFKLDDANKNPLKPMSVATAMSAASNLIVLPDKITEYRAIEFTGTYLDKMIAYVLIAFPAFAASNMMNQICQIEKSLDCAPMESVNPKFRVLY